MFGNVVLLGLEKLRIFLINTQFNRFRMSSFGNTFSFFFIHRWLIWWLKLPARGFFFKGDWGSAYLAQKRLDPPHWLVFSFLSFGLFLYPSSLYTAWYYYWKWSFCLLDLVLIFFFSPVAVLLFSMCFWNQFFSLDQEIVNLKKK